MTAYFFSIHQGESRWWSWIVGLLFIASFTAGCVFFISYIASVFPVSIGNLITQNFNAGTFAYIMLLASFLPIFLAVIITQKIWHLRPMKKLLTSASRFRWSYLLRTMGIIFIFYGVLSFFEYQFFPGEYEGCLLHTSPSPRDRTRSRMPSSA